MQNYQARLEKFEKEREELRGKLSLMKNPMVPLQKRLKQVSKNVEYLKCKIREEKV